MRIGLALAILLFSAPAFAFQTMSPKDVSAEVEAGRMVLVDIRTPDEWVETGVAKGEYRLT